MDSTVQVALIAAAPPTLAIIASHLRTGRKVDKTTAKVDDTNAKVDRIDHAVNNQPPDEPPLVERIKGVAKNVLAIKSDLRVTNERLDGFDTRLTNVERRIG